MTKSIFIMCATTILIACSTPKEASTMAPESQVPKLAVDAPERAIKGGSPNYALPHIYIYKMKADYSDLVPVTMNRERTMIISYPAKSDIHTSAKPIELNDGWYLDRRGIGPNTVFTDYTYEQYASLEKTPTASELMKHIIEKHPLLELHDCGTRSLSIDELNELIGTLSEGNCRL